MTQFKYTVSSLKELALVFAMNAEAAMEQSKAVGAGAAASPGDKKLKQNEAAIWKTAANILQNTTLTTESEIAKFPWEPGYVQNKPKGKPRGKGKVNESNWDKVSRSDKSPSQQD